MKIVLACFIAFFCLCFGCFSGFSEAQAQCTGPSFQLGGSLCIGDSITLTDPGLTEISALRWDHCPGDLNRVPVVTDFGNFQGALLYPRNITIVKDDSLWYGFVNNISAAVVYRLHFGTSLDNTPALDTLHFTTTSSNPGNSNCKLQFHRSGNQWYAVQVTDQNRMHVYHFGSSLANDSITAQTYFNPFSLLANPREMVLVEQNDSLFALIINIQSDAISIISFGNSLGNGPLSGFNETILTDSSLLTSSSSITAVKTCDNWMVFVGSQANDNVARIEFGPYFSNALDGSLIGTNGSLPNPQTLEIVNDSAQWHLFIKSNQGLGLIKASFGSNLTSAPTIQTLGTYGNTINGNFAFGLDMVYDRSRWYCFVANAQSTNERIVRLAYPENCPANTVSGGYPGLLSATEGGQNTLFFHGTDSLSNSYFSLDPIQVSPSPSVDFAATGFCLGDSTAFADSSSSNDTIVQWKWKFGTGDSSILQHPTYLYPDTGAYPVTLTATTVNGCAAGKTDTLFIYPNPVAAFTYDSTCQFALAAVNDVSYSSIGSIVSWEWRTPMDTMTGQNPELILPDTGTVPVTLKVTNTGGCTDSTTAGLFVKPSPVLGYSVDRTCEGDTISFANTSTIASGSMSYLWSFGDGDSSVLTSPDHVYDSLGVYSLALVGLGSNGCTDTLQDSMVISVEPAADIYLDPGTLCTDQEIQFFDSTDAFGQPLIQRTWTFGNGDSSAAEHPVVTYADTGQYLVHLRAYTGTQCFRDDSLLVHVAASPHLGRQLAGHCRQNEVQLSDQSSVIGASAIDSVLWLINGVSVSGMAVTYTAGIDSVLTIRHEALASNGCASVTDTVVYLLDAPVMDLTDPDGLLCSGLSLSMIAEAEMDVQDSLVSVDWKWTSPDTALDSSAMTTFVFTPGRPDSYEVLATLHTATGCTARDSVTIEIEQSPSLSIRKTATSCFGEAAMFSGNYSGSNYTYSWDLGDGATEAVAEVSHVYFNPGLYTVETRITNDATGCYDTASFDHRVLPQPEVFIIADNLCSNTSSVLSDSTNAPFDTVTRWTWEVNGLGTFYGPNPVVGFKDTSAYLVTLTVHTAKGCQAEGSDIVKPKRGPQIDLEWTVESESAPYTVRFEAVTEHATEHFYLPGPDTVFGSPYVDVYATEGAYSITYGARNDNGCEKVETLNFLVQKPRIDLAVAEVDAVETEQGIQSRFTVLNLGNVNIPECTVRLTFNRSVDLLVPIDSGIRAFSQITVLVQDLVDLRGKALATICAELSFGLQSSDLNPANNRECGIFSGAIHFMDPYPNPASGPVTLDFATPTPITEAWVRLWSPSGQAVRQLELGPLEAGYHTVNLDLEGITSGAYFLELQLDAERKTYPISKP